MSLVSDALCVRVRVVHVSRDRVRPAGCRRCPCGPCECLGPAPVSHARLHAGSRLRGQLGQVRNGVKTGSYKLFHPNFVLAKY